MTMKLLMLHFNSTLVRLARRKNHPLRGAAIISILH